MPLLLLMIAVADPTVSAEQLLARTRIATGARVRCAESAQPGEVVVCGRRRADRYRLPLTGGDGGTRSDPTPAQRTALLTPPSTCDGRGAFLVGCGSVGAGVRVSSDGKSRLFTPRELSP